MKTIYPLCLASKSPRRRDLLEMAGYSFTIETKETDEECHGFSPQKTVEIISKRKASAVAAIDSTHRIVLGADTLVFADGTALGKPKNNHEAVSMLTQLSGRTHDVCTGICLIDNCTGSIFSHVETTKVSVTTMSEREIYDYVSTGEPSDKAGAYGIQGTFASYINKIEGDYYNVMGLPLCALRKLLFSANLLSDD